MPEAAKKAESEFYVVRTINRVAENATAAILEYNEKVVKKAVETGKVLAVDARKNTREAVTGIIEDGRKVMTKIPMIETIAPKLLETEADEAEYYVIKAFQKATENATAAIKGYNEAVKKTLENPKGLIEGRREKLVESGKAIVETVKKSAKEAVEGITADGKKLAADGKKLAAQAGETIESTRTLVKTKVQGAVETGLSAVTRAMDLPSRTDIQALTAAMAEFNKKADLILASQAAA